MFTAAGSELQSLVLIVWLSSVTRYIDCAVQKLPPAITPSAAMAQSESKRARHAPHAFVQAPGEHSIPDSSVYGAAGTVLERDDEDMPVWFYESAQKKLGASTVCLCSRRVLFLLPKTNGRRTDCAYCVHEHP